MAPMADYTDTTHISCDPAALFAYLSDVSTIPAYMPRISRAQQREDGVVEVTAHPMIAPGTQVTVEGTAWTRVVDAGRTFAWGSEGGRHGYHGEFEVTPEAQGTRLTVRITTTRADGSAVQAGLADTLAKISALAATI